MKKLNLLFCASLLGWGATAQENNVQILVGPDVLMEYQVVNISANGRWACGNINDGEGRGFLWDLVSDEMVLVAPNSESAPVLDVSDDGTMVGLFTTNEATSNGAPMEVGGIFKDGKWHYLPGCAMPNGISDNGQYIAGIASVGSSYRAATWTLDGEMTVWGDAVGSAYDVNNDGTLTCGWTNHPLKANRTPAMWVPNDSTVADSVLLDYTNIGPFSVARAFSPNGKMIIADQVIYNVETKETTPIDFSNVFGYEFYRVTNSGNAVGHYSSSMYDVQHAAYVKNGKVLDLQNYLQDTLGVDLTGWTLLQCTGITEDERTFAVNAYDTNSVPRPLIIRLDANLTNPAPVALKAVQLEGTDVCRLTWKAPLANVEGVVNYRVWRNGEKLVDLSANEFNYYDRNVLNGNYEYAITAVYADSESEKSLPATVVVADFALKAPRALSAIQRGVRDVRLFWNAPLANRPALKYGSDNAEMASMGGGDYNFEQAVRFEATDLAVYSKQVTDISFYPMCKQNKWIVNFYTVKDTALFASQELDATNLVYGIENTVRLKEPVTLPEGEDIYVAIKVDVTGFGGYSILGVIFNTYRPGYTDLLRREGEESFMSLYENAMNDEGGAYEYPVTFPIGICFGDADQENNDVTSYKVFADGTEVEQTEILSYDLENVADGDHTFSVAAVYGNGEVSESTSVLMNMVGNIEAYKNISKIDIATTDGKTFTATWEVPVDDDETIISYSGEENAGGLAPSAESGYCALYAASYDRDNLGNYDGYLITDLRFYPTAEASFMLVLQKDGKNVYEKELESGVDYTLGDWNTIKMDEPVVVDASSEYVFIVDCYDVEPDKAPIGMDNLPVFTNESDLFSDDNGNTFVSQSTMDNATREGNWMMGMVIRSTLTKPLPIDGYDVVLDRKTVSTCQKENTYSQEVASGIHQIRVNVHYEGASETVTGSVVRFDLAAGIDEMAVSEFVLEATASHFILTGGDVTEVKVYDMAGSLVAQSANAVVDASHLNGGVYLLNAVVDGKNVQHKIVRK